MRTNPAHAPDRESTAAAESRLAMLLHGAMPELLAGFTVEGLAATHRVKPERIEAMLRNARQDRTHD